MSLTVTALEKKIKERARSYVADSGPRPGFREICVPFEWLEQSEEAADATIARVFAQLPADVTVFDSGGHVLSLKPGSQNYMAQLGLIVASREWETLPEGSFIRISAETSSFMWRRKPQPL